MLKKSIKNFSDKKAAFEDNIYSIENKIVEHEKYFNDIFEKLNIENKELSDNLSDKLIDTSIFNIDENKFRDNNDNNYRVLNNNNKSFTDLTDNLQMEFARNEKKILDESNKLDLNKNIEDMDKSYDNNSNNVKINLNDGKSNTKNLTKKVSLINPLNKNHNDVTQNKEIGVLKTSFELSINQLKNQIKLLNKDLNLKINEIKILVNNNQEQNIYNKVLTTENNEVVEKNPIFNMPMFDKINQAENEKKNTKILKENLENMNGARLSLKIVDLEERIIDCESYMKCRILNEIILFRNHIFILLYYFNSFNIKISFEVKLKNILIIH